MAIRKNLQEGWKTAVDLMGKTDRGHSVLPFFTKDARKFYRDLAEQGISTESPIKLAGAVGARLLTDVGDDATRHLYWRYNHPMAIADKLAEQAIGSKLYEYSAPKRAGIQLASVGVPVSASLGIYDATNIGEFGRPKGFAQSYAEQGSEDRRQTGQLGPELIDRFVLGRQGRPLKFETAKEDIPDLTKQRYANYMNYLYNEKGPLGVGVVKGTMENLQGEPEVRIVGFPVGLQAVGALAGGAGAAGAVLRNAAQTEEIKGKGLSPGHSKQKIKRTQLPRARTVAAIGATGALTGALAGKLANTLLASGGQSDLPSTQEYGIS